MSSRVSTAYLFQYRRRTARHHFRNDRAFALAVTSQGDFDWSLATKIQAGWLVMEACRIRRIRQWFAAMPE
jgi:hypothetical protein